MRTTLFAVMALLAGCPLGGTHSSTVGNGGGGSPTADGTDAVASDAKHDRFRPDDFKALLGLTVEQATAKAKQLGHTGTVQVSEARTFVDGCKPDAVCEAEGPMGDTMFFTETLILTVNPKVTIAAPPAD